MARGNDRGDGELDGFKIYLDQETDCVVRLDWENEKWQDDSRILT